MNIHYVWNIPWTISDFPKILWGYIVFVFYFPDKEAEPSQGQTTHLVPRSWEVVQTGFEQL